MLKPLSFPLAPSGLVAAVTLSCSQTAAPPAEAIHAELRAATTVSAPPLTPQQSGTTNRLQAVSPVNDQVVWASGVGGTYTVTTDGGQTWRAGVVPGAEALQFRDVEGQSDQVAYLLAAGPGEQSRIYRTEDGGQHWALQFENHDPNAFYDCFAFWHPPPALTTCHALERPCPVILTIDGRRGDSIP